MLSLLPPLGLMKFLGSLVILEITVNAPNFNFHQTNIPLD